MIKTKKMLENDFRDLRVLFCIVIAVCFLITISVVVDLKNLQDKTETILENQEVEIANTNKIINILNFGAEQ